MAEVKKDADGFIVSTGDSNPPEDISLSLGNLSVSKEESKSDAPQPEPKTGDLIDTQDTKAESAQPASATDLLKSSYEVTVTLADQQADPNSPLFSAKTFEELGLHDDLLKGIYAMKFQKPSKIQERALPLLLQNPPRNMIGQSQSGTGKTAAFVLAMLSRIDYGKEAIQAICIAPSRELARQIMQVVNTMAAFTKATTGYAIQGSIPRGAILNQHIIVATPGALLTAIFKKQIDTSQVKIFVADEADNMLDQQGLGDQTLRVKNQVPRDCQIVLFSATFPDHVRKFANKFAPASNEIRLRQEELSVEGIKQFYMDCKNEGHKYDVLVELYSLLTIGQSIIFCKRRETADVIAARMSSEGHQVTLLHGAKEPAERDRVIDDFRDGKSKVLITTNVVARGIDILQVNMVVNYDMPLTVDNKPDPETYLHRIGRTGRFGRRGISINFVHDRQSWTEMQQIEQALGRPIIRVKTDDFDEMEKTLKKELKA